MSKITRFIAALFFLLVVLAGFIFTSNNNVQVPLWIGVDLAPQSLAIWILLAFAWGGFLGLLLGYGLFRRIKAQFKINQLQARLKQSEGKNVTNPLTRNKGVGDGGEK